MRRLSLLPVFLLLVLSCRSESQLYTSLGPQAAPLRAQFNQDGGKTRVVILSAPN